MEVHFYESSKVYPKDKEILHDWETVRNALENKVPEIHTTQMCELAMYWTLDGYRLFVHQGNGIVYEVKERTKENRDDPHAIRISQHAYHLWASGVFRE